MLSTEQVIAVVIPTRNRSDLAVNAIRSVLDQREPGVSVVVSDNSTENAETDRLAEFCRNLKDERLRYVRPPEPLPLTHHWEWVMGQALAQKEISHVSFLTDRMLFKKGALKELHRVVSCVPSQIVSYNLDAVVDWEEPIHLTQEAWSGDILEIETKELLRLSSLCVFPHCLPRMVNNAVPRSVVEKIRAEFGSVFLSLTPDYCFLYRSLAVEDSIVFLDKPLLIQYALHRSTGHSFAWGVMNSAYANWLGENTNGELRYERLPMPDITTNCNAMMNEYLIVKERTHSPKFPALQIESYLNKLVEEVGWVRDSGARQRLTAILDERGVPTRKNHRSGLAALPRRIKDKFDRELRGPRAKPVWLFLGRTLGMNPPFDQKFGFASVEEALAYDDEFPRSKSSSNHIHPFASVTLDTSLSTQRVGAPIPKRW